MTVTWKAAGPIFQKVFALIGVCTCVVGVGWLGLRLIQNIRPDNVNEIRSPDGHFRIVLTEALVGFPGQICVKNAYVLESTALLDLTDENSRVYGGTCDGLSKINWDGSFVEGVVNVKKSVDGMAGVTLRAYAANGQVIVKWSGE